MNSLTRRKARNQFLPDRIARIATGKRALHNEASARIARHLVQIGAPPSLQSIFYLDNI
jgi:hypothetical protein